MLEQQAFEKGLSLHSKPKQSTEFYEQESITPPQQVMHFDFKPAVPYLCLLLAARAQTHAYDVFLQVSLPPVSRSEIVETFPQLEDSNPLFW